MLYVVRFTNRIQSAAARFIMRQFRQAMKHQRWDYCTFNEGFTAGSVDIGVMRFTYRNRIMAYVLAAAARITGGKVHTLRYVTVYVEPNDYDPSSLVESYEPHEGWDRYDVWEVEIESDLLP